MNVMTILKSILVLGILGGLFGALLAFASKIFHVEVDPKEAAIRECVAGANCGGCGYPGCDGYAAAVAKGEAPVNACVAGGQEAADKIAEIMGVSAGSAEKKVAFVPCSGGEKALARFNYTGPKDCRAAMLFGGKSNKLCTFACIGYGNCVSVCQFGGMSIVDGVARVDRSKCIGCGSCVDACPKNIIKLLPASQVVHVGCSSKLNGAMVNKECKAGCIGCSKCARECPADAITLVDNRPVIDNEKCVKCGHCADVCPRHVMKYLPET